MKALLITVISDQAEHTRSALHYFKILIPGQTCCSACGRCEFRPGRRIRKDSCRAKAGKMRDIEASLWLIAVAASLSAAEAGEMQAESTRAQGQSGEGGERMGVSVRWMLGSKSPYVYNGSMGVSDPEGCSPSLVLGLLRHGTRNPGKSDTKHFNELRSASVQPSCTNTLNILSWSSCWPAASSRLTASSRIIWCPGAAGKSSAPNTEACVKQSCRYGLLRKSPIMWFFSDTVFVKSCPGLQRINRRFLLFQSTCLSSLLSNA